MGSSPTSGFTFLRRHRSIFVSLVSLFCVGPRLKLQTRPPSFSIVNGDEGWGNLFTHLSTVSRRCASLLPCADLFRMRVVTRVGGLLAVHVLFTNVMADEMSGRGDDGQWHSDAQGDVAQSVQQAPLDTPNAMGGGGGGGGIEWITPTSSQQLTPGGQILAQW